MNGVSFNFDENSQNVLLTLAPKQMESEISATVVLAALKEAGFDEVYLSQSAVKACCDKANHLFKTNDPSIVTEEVGERRNAEVAFQVSDDEMSASLSLTAPYGGHFPSKKAVQTLAKKTGIERGISHKRISRLLEELKNVGPGEVVDGIIAKGLPAKDGRSSYMKPLVPNALERVLSPQTDENGKTDLRNLGEVICVKANTPVVRRMPPTKGRHGYTVTNNKIDAGSGKWLPIKMGEGTVASEQDENLILASISGMPKFRDLTMSVDDTFICKGVNVGTGHVKYDGAVLVNGDVAEKMRIEATGDVTINGFVESAYIEAGGDIIITEGAMGKEVTGSDDHTCILKSSGSIHVQHGQGLDIRCTGDVSIGRQLAYSKLVCGGKLTVGQIDNPKGNLFACDIQPQNSVIAGTLGAVSGSTLRIDFSEGLNLLNERLDNMEDLLKQLRENNSRHKEKFDLIESKKIPKSLLSKVNAAQEMFQNETALLHWLELKAANVKESKIQYQKDIKIVANKKLYSGVSVKLNNRSWRSEREYDRAMVMYKEHEWSYEPLVN
jgi:uncharacterized protein (DUF342 family)